MGEISWDWTGTSLEGIFRLDEGLFDNMPLITAIRSATQILKSDYVSDRLCCTVLRVGPEKCWTTLLDQKSGPALTQCSCMP